MEKSSSEKTDSSEDSEDSVPVFDAKPTPLLSEPCEDINFVNVKPKEEL